MSPDNPPVHIQFYRHRVSQYLAEVDDIAKCRPCMAATHIGKAERSLGRILKQSGTTFEELRKRERARRAITYLNQNPHTPVEYLTVVAGYAHASTFTRAFKSWIGESVTQYRKRLLDNERRKYRERNVHNTPSRARIHAERRPGVANRVRSKTQGYAVS